MEKNTKQRSTSVRGGKLISLFFVCVFPAAGIDSRRVLLVTLDWEPSMGLAAWKAPLPRCRLVISSLSPRHSARKWKSKPEQKTMYCTMAWENCEQTQKHVSEDTFLLFWLLWFYICLFAIWCILTHELDIKIVEKTYLNLSSLIMKKAQSVIQYDLYNAAVTHNLIVTIKYRHTMSQNTISRHKIIKLCHSLFCVVFVKTHLPESDVYGNDI